MKGKLNSMKYKIIINTHMDTNWADWFDGMFIFHNNDGTTTLIGKIPDQAALQGILKKLSQLNLELISVEKINDSINKRRKLMIIQENMSTSKKTARVVGALFLTAIVTWILGAEAFIAPILNAPDYLINLYPNKDQLIIGVLFELINAAVVVGIAAVMFPILKKYNDSIAIGYVGFRVIEATILVVSLIGPLVLITLSQDYINAGASDGSSFQTLGAFAVEWRYRSGQVVPFFVGGGGLMLTYLLYQSKLIPRLISTWGFIGYALLLTLAALQIFGFEEVLILGLPVGLFEIFLGIWLIAKGFNSPAIESASAKSNIN